MFYYKQETNYEAPKWMEGEYKLKVHGRKITIERLGVADDGVPTKSHATCHKHDQFDIGDGTKVALDRLKEKKAEADRQKFKVGDIVKVINAGSAYSSLKHFDESVWAARYRYGVTPYGGMIVKIVGWYDKEKTMAIVEEENGKQLGNPVYSNIRCYGGIYVIGVAGLARA